ncbi:MAG: hypothetical protein P9M06_06185 [Candidatus Saelkia tenebricola]|nr:hypothetical protein [Candidatus Saelkia tenebricola]
MGGEINIEGLFEPLFCIFIIYFFNRKSAKRQLLMGKITLKTISILIFSTYLILPLVKGETQNDRLYINNTFGLKATVPNWPITIDRHPKQVVFKNPLII